MNDCIILRSSESEHILTLLVAVQQGADKRVTYKLAASNIERVPTQTLRRMRSLVLRHGMHQQ